MAGLRPVQIWVPDTRRPDFAEECRRQSRLVAQADRAMTVKRDKIGQTFGRIDGDALVEVERCLAVLLGIAK